MKTTFKRVAKLVLGCACVVFSALALHDGYRMHQANVRFSNEGILTSGVVRHLSPNPQSSNYPYLAHVEYHIPDGQLVSVQIPVLDNEARLARSEQSLPVQYLNASPKTARIHRSKGGVYLALVGGLLALAVGVFLLWPRRARLVQVDGSAPASASNTDRGKIFVAPELVQQDCEEKGASSSADVAETKQNDNFQPFASPGFGFLLFAPPGWMENSDEKHFQVIDPATGTQFTASGYDNPGIDLEQWAEARLGMLADGMPFMKRLCPPYPLSGNGWHGIATECRGTFPGDEKESHYIVLCFMSGARLVSFTITASVEAFHTHEALYRDIVKSRLLLTQAMEA